MPLHHFDRAPASPEKMLERAKAGNDPSSLDPSDRRLRRMRALGQAPL